MRKTKPVLLLLGLIVVSLCLSSCSASKAKLPVVANSATPSLSLTPEATAIVTATPEPTTTSTPTVTATVTSTPKPVPPFDYLVQNGDTLGLISQEYSVPVALIILENNLVNPDLIYVGQLLHIPDPVVTPKIISKTGKQILVILSLQKVYAYENGQLQREFTVSTGVAEHPTVVGTFATYVKLEKTRMTGDGYDLPDVPWTMYFYQDYGIHGTYWHHNFGHPMSHGCVNMQTDEAKWLYDWAPKGTTVIVQP